jgi:hypothetical protein
MDIEKLVEGYVRARDKKAELKAEFTKKTASLDEWMARAEGVILKELQAQNLESVRTASGTAYKNVQTSATVADWDSVLGFIKENDAWTMLERKVNKTAVQEFRAMNNDLPPGVNWREEVVVNIRRS